MHKSCSGSSGAQIRTSGAQVVTLNTMSSSTIHLRELRAHRQRASCRINTQEQQQILRMCQLPLSASTWPVCRTLHFWRCRCRANDSCLSTITTGSCNMKSTLLAYGRHERRHHSKTGAAASSSERSNMGDNSSGTGSRSGVIGLLQKWNEDTRKLRRQLQSLGLAGVVAYGLFNTLYYTLAFLFVWFNIANVPAGLGVQPALRKAAEVFAMVWAGSQVTKLARAGAALAFAPVVDQCLNWGVEKLKLKSKQQAFALVVVACLALAAAVLGAVVAVHA